MWQQVEFRLQERRRGFYLVTSEILRNLPTLPKTGLLNLFIQHTSAALSVNENADPDVRVDMESIFNHLVKEREPYWLTRNLVGIDKIKGCLFRYIEYGKFFMKLA